MVTEQQTDALDADTTASCPYCAAELLTIGTHRLDPVRCSHCGRSFTITIGRAGVRTSRLSVASAVVGLCSVMCGFISGIPAVLLGVLALRRIGRSERRLQGRVWAYAGIASGSLMTVACGGMVGMIIWMGNSVSSTREPEQVSAIAAALATFQMPEQVQPVRAESLPMGMKVVTFGDKPRRDKAGVFLTMMHYPKWMGYNAERARAQTALHDGALRGKKTESEEEFKIEANGQELVVVRFLRSDPEGPRYRAYATAYVQDHGVVLLIVSVDETPASADEAEDRFTMTEAEVRQLLASYVPAS